MATPKIILFDFPTNQRKDGTFPVCLKVTHQRKRKYFSLNKHCLKEQWNKEKSEFRKNLKDYKKLNDVLDSVLQKAKDIIRDFERDGIPFSFKLFDEKFRNIEKSNKVIDVFTDHINKLIQENKPSSAAPFQSTLNSLLQFIDDTKRIKHTDFKLVDIDYKFLVAYEHWLRTERSCKDTSIAVYMKQLRSIINKAIKSKIIKREYYPFDEYSIADRLKLKTRKRAIDKSTIKKIAELELPELSKEQFAQHIFLFSFYTRGMNFVDIAYLTPENIIGDRLEYIRSKTKQPFSLKLLPPAKEILDFYIKHKVTKGDFIFPVFDESIHKTAKQKFDRRKTVLRDVNKILKELAKMIGMDDLKLTTYVSRHSYATTLKNANVSIAKISEAMGHQTEKITETYLKQFENDELDKADENLL